VVLINQAVVLINQVVVLINQVVVLINQVVVWIQSVGDDQSIIIPSTVTIGIQSRDTS